MKLPWKINPIIKFINQQRLRIKLGSLISLIVFGYMFFATGAALWQNYEINQEIFRLKDDIAALEIENTQLKNLIAYLKTESFKEKEARRKLGYKKPGEIVVALPKDNFFQVDPGITDTDGKTETKPQLTNPQKWWEYILG